MSRRRRTKRKLTPAQKIVAWVTFGFILIVSIVVNRNQPDTTSTTTDYTPFATTAFPTMPLDVDEPLDTTPATTSSPMPTTVDAPGTSDLGTVDNSDDGSGDDGSGSVGDGPSYHYHHHIHVCIGGKHVHLCG